MDRVVLFLVAITASCSALQQADVDYIGANLGVKISVHDNTKYDGAKHRFSLYLTNTGSEVIRPDNWSIYFYSFFMIEPGHLPSAEGYTLPNYKVKFNHIKGCLFSMTPTPDFPNILPNGSHFIEFFGQWWTVTRTDIPPNWYVTGQNMNPANIESTATGKKFVTNYDTIGQWKRYRNDQFNPFTPQDRYRRQKVRNFNTHAKMIIPTPKHITVLSQQSLRISEMTAVCTQNVSGSCILLNEKLGMNTNIDNNANNDQQRNTIRIFTNSSIGENSGFYRLHTDISKSTVTLVGSTPTAVHYGIQSLLSLVAGSHDKNSMPDVSIEDEPRFQHRGMHVDVTRNFRTKTDILRLMDAMSMYKMNKLHLHLSDDEGWRIEIPGIPELTKVGGKRCHDLGETKCIIPQLGSGGDDNTSGSGYFNVSEFQDILREATKRHIDVIPEIDMPGHFHAGIKAMEARYLEYENSNPELANQYRLIDPNDTSKYESVQMFNDNAINPCIESTYTFVEKVVSEIQKMYEKIQPLKFFHFGGDETAKNAWVNSSACQKLAHTNSYYEKPHHLKEYFVKRIANITNSLGLNLAGWEDGLMGDDEVPIERTSIPNSEVYANGWQNIWEWGIGRRAYVLANNGYKVVMSHATHFFFDQPQAPDPEESGLYWATRYTDAMKTFYFLPDRLYDNIHIKRSGERITKAEVCGDNNEKCPPLQNKENIIGLQGQSWAETFMTPEIFDYMIFPRLLSLAERAWHKASWEDLENPEKDIVAAEDWEVFANTIGHKELDRLGKLGIKYRIAPPGAIVEDGFLKVSTEFPGHIVQYSKNNGTSWLDVPNEWFLKDNRSFLMRTSTKDRTRFSRVVKFYPEEPLPISDQHLVDYIAGNLHIRYDVTSNLVNDWQNFTAKITMKNTGTRDISLGNWEIYFFSIRLIQPNDFPFQHGYLLQDCNMKVYHAGGSLFKLTPAGREFSLKSKGNLACTIVAKYWQSARTDCMPNWYVTAEGMQAKDIKSTENEALTFVGPFTRPEQYRRYPADTYHPYTPEERYNINEAMTVSGMPAKHIIPTPVNINLEEGSVNVDPSWVILNSTKYSQGIHLISNLFGVSIQNTKPSSKYIEIETVENLDLLEKNETHDEAYWIVTTDSSITISVRTTKGVFYAYQSLRSLTNGGKVLPVGVINDQPRFQYRGMHVDVGRNFHSKEEILKILDAMAMYKLNKLHFHLTEDEGWRLEIPGLPELTEVGSKRCHDLSEDECVLPQLGSGSAKDRLGSGFYTIEDYKEILRFANDRHIEVIPEIDMPGHCRAGIKAMEARFRKYMKFGNETAAREYLMTDFTDISQYLSVQLFTDNAINLCMNSTTAFITYIIRALKTMHEDIQPLKMYNFGGDEVVGAWKDSPECRKFMNNSGFKHVSELKKYFAHLMDELTDNEGLNVAAWGDGLKEGLTPYDLSEFPSKRDITAVNWENVWEWGQGDKAYKLANAGYKVILGHATHLYFDHPYEPDPEERGFYWATRFTDIRKTFGYVPSNIYYNADKAGNGKPLTPDQICTHNGTCLQLEKPENIIGMQGHVWTETIRTADELQEMVFPRLLALAERAWHESTWENIDNKEERIKKTNEDWTSFAKALQNKELARLEKLGINYRIPVPGGRLIKEKLNVNTDLPSLTVQYSADNKRTWNDIPVHTEISGLPDGKEVYLRTRSVDGARYSRVISFRTPEIASVSPNKVPSALLIICMVLMYFS
ncbi:uncharacterized protein LOC133198156 [Saccostrea echinata]|uniref:uncharacterized protein LOC133198156 n=1 Tax=Saccostrea echinata TaxID=191078 RepID=UPI002A84103A|nr:uncharacterized protein LOC133198156 [Saccostrea echinata]